MTIIKKNIFLILALAISIFAVVSLFHSGFFPIHDDEQVARVYELNYDLISLHFPPRLSQNLGFGYGYPFFNFYPSFAYYVAEIFVLLGFSYITSVKIMIALGFFLAALFMYLFSKQYLGESGALVAATLYTYAPYHSIDVYVRGALPEFWAFVFVPAVFWAMFRIGKNPTFGNATLLGFFGAGLMITHNLVALMIIPFAFIYFLYLLYAMKNYKNFFISAALGVAIALMLSSYFWIPAIFENKYTMVGLLTKELADYRLHFVSLSQFASSAWGYGGSVLGPYDVFSLEVGKIHLLLVAIVLTFFAISYFKNKTKSGALIVFLILFLLSLFLQSYYSHFVWENIQALSYLQFPWRFMIFSVFTSSFIAGYLFVFKFDRKIKIILAAVIVAGALFFYANLFKPSKFLNVSDDYYTNQDVIRWKTSKMAFEYAPLGIATRKSDLNTTVVDIDENEIAKTTATPLSDGISTKSLIDKPQYKKIEVVSVEKGEIQINTFSFPGWKVFMNHTQISYNDRNKLKLITVNVPKGSSLVEAKFSETTTRQIADLLSVLGIVFLVLLLSKRTKEIKL